jgi:D-serine deaminase-like pyridoxal phosphate-dependent protein
MFEREIDTPALIVDLSAMESNIRAMADAVRAGGKSLRPHVKSHKVPAIAHLQIAAGATGIACQKLGEAEVMVGAGMDDVLVPYPIVGPLKIERLLRLSEQARVTTVVDSLDGARALSEAARRVSGTLPVLLEIDVGYRRCGVQPEAAALLAECIVNGSDFSGLVFEGLLAYEGHVYEGVDRVSADALAVEAYDTLAAAVQSVRERGIPVNCVSAGATATAARALADRHITELRPGSYVFNDRFHMEMGWCDEDSCALSVLATVVSAPSAHRVVIDAGSKALSFATVPSGGGYGHVKGYPALVLDRLADEHGMVCIGSDGEAPKIGSRIEIIPNQHTVVVDSFDRLFGIRQGKIEEIWPIAARGRMQ